jgi:hypothetical protein
MPGTALISATTQRQKPSLSGLEMTPYGFECEKTPVALAGNPSHAGKTMLNEKGEVHVTKQGKAEVQTDAHDKPF